MHSFSAAKKVISLKKDYRTILTQLHINRVIFGRGGQGDVTFTGSQFEFWKV